jgi:hypothetical protein
MFALCHRRYRVIGLKLKMVLPFLKGIKIKQNKGCGLKTGNTV